MTQHSHEVFVLNNFGVLPPLPPRFAARYKFATRHWILVSGPGRYPLWGHVGLALVGPRLPPTATPRDYNAHSSATRIVAAVCRRPVLVLDNMRRPDWSTGHLARDWNQCLVNGAPRGSVASATGRHVATHRQVPPRALLRAGFGSLASPSADLVVCMQADNEVAPQFGAALLKLHGACAPGQALGR